MSEHQVQIRREALTMALYVSITLLAALVVADGEPGSDIDVLAVVWGTTVGLVLAHWYAFGLAAQLVDPTGDRRIVGREMAAQLEGAFAVAAATTVVVVALPDARALMVARYTMAAIIPIVSFAHVRALGGSWTRAVLVGVATLVLAEGVAAVKRVLGH